MITQRLWPFTLSSITITDLRHGTAGALLALPYLLVTAVAATDLVVGARIGVLPLLALSPAVAAVYGGVAYTAAAGGTAGAVCGGIDAYQTQFRSAAQSVAFAAVLAVTGVALAISASRQRRARELADIRAIAHAAQQAVLRPVPARLASPIQVGVHYISAAAGARIGGDLYEVLTCGRAVRLIIGDVKGKGLPAVQTAAIALGAFRDIAPEAPELGLIASRMEHALAGDLAEEGFITAVIAEVSPDGSSVMLLNCGHPPPLHLQGPAAAFIQPRAASLPLGLSRLGRLPWQVTKVALRPADHMLFYTDGISEARSPSGEFFPLMRAALQCPRADVDQMLRTLGDHVGRHVGGALRDDAAMLLIHRRQTLGRSVRQGAAGRRPSPSTGLGPPARLCSGGNATARSGGRQVRSPRTH